MNRKDFSNLLMKRRPDLWGISRTLAHCLRNTPTYFMRALVWENLIPEDQAILKDINAGRLPEAFKLQTGDKA